MSESDPNGGPANLRAALANDLASTRATFLPNAVGNAATLGLATAIEALMVGLEDDARPVVERSRIWLEDSIERHEIFGDPPSLFVAIRHEALALTHWLLDNGSWTKSYQDALAFHEASWKGLGRDRGLSIDQYREFHLSEYVRDCFEAGEFERGVQSVQRFDRETASIKVQLNAEVDLAQRACRRRLEGEGLDAGFVRTGERILQARVPEWLRLGDTPRIAAWAKFVFWNRHVTETPMATLHKTAEMLPP